MNELLSDREALACIIEALPQASQDKWYDKDIPDDTYKKGEVLLEWLEKQRKNSVRIRLDAMAAKIRTPTVARTKPSASVDSTEKGLISSSLHAQGSGRTSDKNHDGAPSDSKQDEKTKTPRIEVKTLADAQKIAERRKKNLEEHKLDRCPVCDQKHMYERTWTTVSPPIKVQMLSTHLTTCP